MCGNAGPVFTAPGGLMVCQGCLDIIKRIKLQRLKGASVAAIAEALRLAIDELEDELKRRSRQGGDDMGELDAVLVRDVHTGRVELRHGGCVGDDEPLEGISPSPVNPSHAKKCMVCGELIEPESGGASA